MASLKDHLLGQDGAAGVELLADHIGGKRDRAAGVFLFADAEKIRRVADLRLDFFLAIAVIVIGDDRDDNAARLSRQVSLKAPPLLYFSVSSRQHMPSRAAVRWRPVVTRQAEIFLLHPGNVRS
jgi:hypothetical protein